jgi:hypothetical protein
MRLRHSCGLENRKVDNKTAASEQAQRGELGPVKKACGCRLASFCVFGQNQPLQVEPVPKKTSVADTHRTCQLMRLGGHTNVSGAVANTALRTASCHKKEKKGCFRVRRRVRVWTLSRGDERHSMNICEPRNRDA